MWVPLATEDRAIPRGAHRVEEEERYGLDSPSSSAYLNEPILTLHEFGNHLQR
jgi:hypothetical protein